MTLNSGQRADLTLLVRKNDNPAKYLPYQLDRPNAPEQKSPNEAMEFDSSREFVVEMQHSYGKKKFKLDLKVAKGYDGNFYMSF